MKNTRVSTGSDTCIPGAQRIVYKTLLSAWDAFMCEILVLGGPCMNNMQY